MPSPSHLKHFLRYLMLLSSIVYMTTYLYGEGTVNFIDYPGYRLFYNASVDQQLKVYASEGEFINVGASHVGIREGFIQVFRPDGTLHTVFDGTDDLAIINDNIEELNGPTGGGSMQGTGYTPGVVEVSTGEAGIWTIILDYPAHNLNAFDNLLNNAPWTRADDQPTNRRVVLAWDITVSTTAAGNEGGLLQTGRVYSNEYISIINRNGVTTSPIFYVLSKDGYQYRVNFNETDPFGFPLSANNRGVVTGDFLPTYQSARQNDISINTSIDEWLEDELYLYAPQARDTLSFVNHKIFFNPPDPAMPTAALVTEVFTQDIHTTWLFNNPTPVTFEATDIEDQFEVACEEDSLVLDSTYIYFESSEEGVVSIAIDMDNNDSFQDEVDVQLLTLTESGMDSILWNGRNGLGEDITLFSDTVWRIQLSIQTGEIHIFNQDIENDLGGLTITRINGNNAPNTEFYYDHSSVGGTVSGGGTPGNALSTDQSFTYDNNFGNEILFDYWAFAIVEELAITASFSIIKNNTQSELDTDGDGINNILDEDDDNDGILDEMEFCSQSTACPLFPLAPNEDLDNDCIENYLDADNLNFTLNCPDINQDGICDSFPVWADVDRDNIPNFLDADSDNDGIPDSTEGSTDPDGDTIPNFLDEDSDNDGIPDSTEGSADPDGDTIPNFLDEDSDNDGIPDSTEGSADPDNDTIPNFLDGDSDNDGIPDSTEGSADPDNDTIPNFLDEDSDNDGIPDSTEGSADPDNDTIPNFLDEDSDNDGIPDSTEGSADPDNDNIPNFLDEDSDNDGIPDSTEGSADPDNDNIPNFLDEDSDNDGIPDSTEGSADLDNDTIPNFLDEDSDNDGIPDSTEGSADPDNDTIPNFLDADSDNDGIPDSTEGIVDPDNDTIPNFLDTDSDNDGIPDSTEGSADPDNDTIPNFLDEDSDNDGISDSTEGSADPDNDTIPNFLDEDSDNDGIPDSTEGSADPDNDTIPNFLDGDSDNDGIPDSTEGSADPDADTIPNFLDGDSDNDGIPDSTEGSADPDNDTIPNFLDADSDNDGIPDSTEGSADPDGDTIPNFLDGDSDNDGIPDSTEGSADPDNDTIPNFLDADSDNDSISDELEGNADIDSDSIPNYLDLDSDNDGINDVLENGVLDQDGNAQADGDDFNGDGLVDNAPPVADSDGDGIPNYLDLDSDNDGALDIIENNGSLADVNGDGMADGMDEDQDGILSSVDDNDTIFGEDRDMPINNTDGTDVPDFIDTDSDNDGTPDIVENGYADLDQDMDGMADAPFTDADGDGIPDTLDGNDAVFGNFSPTDIDGDGVENLLDMDDDNDGIPDSLELCKNNPNCPFLIFDPAADEDGDGIPNFEDANDVNFRLDCVDADADGRCDYPPLAYDTDEDDVPNHLDLDSDNDGISDIAEAGFIALDTNGNGRIDGSPANFGTDGIFNDLPDTNIPDTDGDGVFNFLDIDSDNDGFFDVQEGQYRRFDEDNNGRFDNTSRSPSVNRDGIGDVLEGGSFQVPLDSDGDGFYNAIDLDSDNDGIGDVLEGGARDLDRDGFIGTSPLVVNFLGQVERDNDNISLSPYRRLLDTDSDGIFNFIDLDSDNDGIGDVLEGGTSLSRVGGGIGDVLEGGSYDLDRDGFIGSAPLIFNDLGQVIDDPSDLIFNINIPPLDTDGDGIFNFIDLDSDNDGIGDVLEGGTSLSRVGGGIGDVLEGGSYDLDRDGFIGSSPLIFNDLGQVIDDPSDLIFNINVPPLDTDGDGIFNFIDLDSDNDGIGDVLEGGTSLSRVGGGIGDVLEGGSYDLDRDGFIGLAPLIFNDLGQVIDDPSDLIFNINIPPLDTDGDGIFNFIDLDSDNDGIGDVLEGGASLSRVGGGIGDVLEGGNLDLNRDGFVGTTSLVTNTLGQPVGDDSDFVFLLNNPPIDSDKDGVFNFIDSDSDNDGIGDVLEGGTDLRTGGIGDVLEGGSFLTFDFNNNGYIGGLDILLNPFGQPVQSMSIALPINIIPADTDGDGVDNTSDLDSDDDGINDVLEADGIDEDGNGQLDGMIQSTGSTGEFLIVEDLDQDSIPDFLDLDIDGDGISDLAENGGQTNDTNFDGLVDGMDADGDGLKDLEDGLPNEFGDAEDGGLRDTDNDGIPDIKDIDFNGNEINDITEIGLAELDPNGDGVIDDLTDVDRDGIADTIDTNPTQFGGIVPTDSDRDGIPNIDDLDNDNDGISDEIEIANARNGGDTDNDGVLDHLDLDSDNDGIWDITENGFASLDTTNNGTVDFFIDDNQDGIADTIPLPYTILDADMDGTPNHIDLDSDNDQLTDSMECPTPSNCPDFDQDGIPDYLDVDCSDLSIPAIILSAVDSILCEGESTIITAINTQPSPFPVSYTWRGTDRILISETNSQADTFELVLPEVSANAEGFYYFNIQSEQENCVPSEDSIFIEIIANEELMPILTIAEDTVCSGSDALLTATVIGLESVNAFNWYFVKNDTTTLIDSTTVPSLTLSNIGESAAGFYQVEAVSNNCGSVLSNTAVLSIREPIEMIDVMTSKDLSDSLCIGESVSFAVELIANTTYQWITPTNDTINNRIITIDSVTLTNAGIYQAIASVDNCFDVMAIPIELSVRSLTVPPNIQPIDPICLGANLVLTIETPISNAQYDWFKNDNNFIASTTQNFIQITETISEADTGQYFVIASIEDCSSLPSESVHVTVIDTLVEQAIVGDDQLLCEQDSTQIIANGPTEGIGFWRSISTATINQWDSINPIVPLELGINTFVWTIQHPQCDNQSMDTLLVNNTAAPMLVAFAGEDTTLCFESSIQLNAQSLPDSIMGSWQSLSSATITQPNLPNAIVANLVTGEHRLIWSLSTDLCTDFSQDTLVITRTMPPNEMAQVGFDQQVCEATEVVLQAMTPEQSIGQWTSLDKNTIAAPNNPNTTVTNLQIGENRMVWSLSTDECVDYSQDTVLITKIVPPEEMAFAGDDQQICMEDTIRLNATIPDSANGLWTSIDGLSFDSDMGPRTLVSNLQEGENQFIWTLSFQSCLNYDSDTVSIIKMTPPDEVAFAGVDQRFCAVDRILLNAERGLNALGEWQLPNNVTINERNNPDALVTNLVAGERYDFVWQLSTEICPNFSQDTVQIIIDSIPNLFATIIRDDFESTPNPSMPDMDFVLCDPNSFLLEAILPENTTGNWKTVNDVSLEQLSDGMALVSQIAEEQLQFVWSLSQNSCEDFSADTIGIEILRADGLAANSDGITTFFNEPISTIDLIANDSIPADMAWIFNIVTTPEGIINDLGDGLIDYTPRTNFFGTDSLIYELCHEECPELCDTATVTFQVRGINSDNTCFIPNILTPNGDGDNDVFVVPCLSEFPDHELSIFNRWGDEVFRAAPYENNWEGTHKFVPLPPGTYFYILALTDDPMDQLAGYLTIIR